MTDHIGEATTMIDLDALEKLADEVSIGSISGTTGAETAYRNSANPATVKALIAELKEAREALIAVKVSADHMPPMSSTRRIEWRIRSFNPAIALVRAFLARNGKGEGK